MERAAHHYCICDIIMQISIGRFRSLYSRPLEREYIDQKLEGEGPPEDEKPP